MFIQNLTLLNRPVSMLKNNTEYKINHFFSDPYIKFETT